MGNEIDLMSKYPKTKRDVLDRGIKKTEQDIAIARKFDKEFFDGDRKFGYGGFSYNPNPVPLCLYVFLHPLRALSVYMASGFLF